MQLSTTLPISKHVPVVVDNARSQFPQSLEKRAQNTREESTNTQRKESLNSPETKRKQDKSC